MATECCKMRVRRTLCITTTNQSDAKSYPNPNPNNNPTTKQPAAISIQLNIVACPTYREIHARQRYCTTFRSHCHSLCLGLYNDSVSAELN